MRNELRLGCAADEHELFLMHVAPMMNAIANPNTTLITKPPFDSGSLFPSASCNVMGIGNAAHAETDPYASSLFITPLSCSLVGKTMEVTVQPGGQAASAYQTPVSLDAYYCNFGLNPAHREPLEQAGLKVSGADQDGSTSANPHPLILEFCRSAMRNERSAPQLKANR